MADSPRSFELADRAQFELRIAPVTKRLGDTLVRMLAYNGSVPGHYADLSENIFRFLPLRLSSDDLKRMHGIDERVGVRDYEMAIPTYRRLVVNAAGI